MTNSPWSGWPSTAWPSRPNASRDSIREAQILAALNHPHIAAIYGVEQAGDTTALVLEFIDGPTLADRIARGSIPLDEALPIANRHRRRRWRPHTSRGLSIAISSPRT